MVASSDWLTGWESRCWRGSTVYRARASRSIQGRWVRRKGQYTSTTPTSFCKRPTAVTKSTQEHEFGSGRVDLALVRVLTLTLADGLVGEDVCWVTSVCCCCGGGSRIAWMMVLTSDSVIDRSLTPSNKSPT